MQELYHIMIPCKKLSFVLVLLLCTLLQIPFAYCDPKKPRYPATYSQVQQLLTSCHDFSNYSALLLGAALAKRSAAMQQHLKKIAEDGDSGAEQDTLGKEAIPKEATIEDASIAEDIRLSCDIYTIQNKYAFPKYAALLLGAAVMAGIQKKGNCCCKTCRFQKITAFGDSYTDIGNAPPRPETPCFSSSGNVAPDTNPGGKIWVQALSKELCINIRPSSQGGSDYAVSGATSAQMLEQAQSFAKSNCALFCNNLVAVRPVITDFVNALLITNTPPPIQQVVDNTLAAITTLHNAGACYLLVPNMINLGLLPSFALIDLIPEIGTATSVAFNAGLSKGINSFCFDVLQVDAFGLEQEIFAKPCCFCFIDMIHPCCCVCPAFPTPSCATAYFWDLLDPTGRAHQAFADYVDSILNGPTCFARVTEFSLEAVYGHNSALKQQLAPLAYNKSKGCPSFFIGADYAPLLQQPLQKCCFGQEAKARSFSLVSGGVYPISDTSLVGASYGFSRPQSKGSSCCSFDTNIHTVSLFTTHYTDKYYVTALGNASTLQTYINRHFAILSRSTHARGSTHGNQVGAEVEAAYYFMQHDQLRSGMIANFEYNRIKTYGYTEKGAGSANLSYKTRVRQSCITGLGIQANTHKEYMRGHLVTNFFGILQRDWLIAQHDVRFHVTSMQGSHARLPFCLPYNLVASCGFDTSFSTKCGIVAAIGYHAKIGAKKYYTNLITGSLSWDF